MRLGIHALLYAAVLAAPGAAGCLRFGYAKTSALDAGAPRHDSGTDAAGAGGTGADTPQSGSRAAGAGSSGSAGTVDSDAGMTRTPLDAGTDAASALDAGPPVVSEKCPEQPGVAFCDGFEDPAFTRWAYAVIHNGTLTLTTARAHSGSTSLLATTGPPSPLTETRRATDVLAEQMSGDAWMRFYNWVPSSVIVTDSFSVGVMSESAEPYEGFELRILPDATDINANGRTSPGNTLFPRDRWVCVELHVYIHPSEGFYEAYLDGKLAVHSTPSADTQPVDGFSVAEVGVHFAGPNQDSVQVYVDDVAVGTSRIPCD